MLTQQTIKQKYILKIKELSLREQTFGWQISTFLEAISMALMPSNYSSLLGIVFSERDQSIMFIVR